MAYAFACFRGAVPLSMALFNFGGAVDFPDQHCGAGVSRYDRLVDAD